MEILAGRGDSATWSQPRKKVRTEFLTEMSMQLCNSFVHTSIQSLRLSGFCGWPFGSYPL